ncbi:hypothetical protein BRX43_15785 [Sphingomonas sp. S-NIH.Pt15_0812]|nr:hypothetical protein BRX43_15785 [Sphingomonas sp. S-NIH.Pt15_0812]
MFLVAVYRFLKGAMCIRIAACAELLDSGLQGRFDVLCGGTLSLQTIRQPFLRAAPQDNDFISVRRLWSRRDQLCRHQ